MKWPKSLTFVRHAQSAYNELREKKAVDPEYEQFKNAFETEKFASDVNWPELTTKLRDRYELKCSDRDTPLTEAGHLTAIGTGNKLPGLIYRPDVIFVSPYLRTRQTYKALCLGWPRLNEAPAYFDERIRELDHGMSLLYNDRRMFFHLHPEQRAMHKLLGPYDYRYPQGENVPDVRLRVRDWRATLIRECFNQNVLVITHHITILSFRADQERLSPEQYQDLDDNDKPINCGITQYCGNPGHGSRGHLELKFYNMKLY